jgi:hypothetical protein
MNIDDVRRMLPPELVREQDDLNRHETEFLGFAPANDVDILRGIDRFRAYVPTLEERLRLAFLIHVTEYTSRLLFPGTNPNRLPPHLRHLSPVNSSSDGKSSLVSQQSEALRVQWLKQLERVAFEEYGALLAEPEQIEAA